MVLVAGSAPGQGGIVGIALSGLPGICSCDFPNANGVRRALIPPENKRTFLEVSGDIVERMK